MRRQPYSVPHVPTKRVICITKAPSTNFNPMIAMAADLVIAEVEEIVPIGTIKPEDVHTQSILVDFIVKKQ